MELVRTNGVVGIMSHTKALHTAYAHLFRVAMPQGYMFIVKEVYNDGDETIDELEDHFRFKYEQNTYVANLLDCSVVIERYDAEKNMLLGDDDMILYIGCKATRDLVCGNPEDSDAIWDIIDSVSLRKGINLREMIKNKSLPLEAQRQ